MTILYKENYLIIIDKIPYDDNDVLKDHRIKGLTDKGYKTLDLIRDDEIWNKMKEKLPNFDEVSIFTIFDIANKIKNVEINNLFDLPKDLFIQNNRC